MQTNSNKITVSAPGKLMLLGEHAVVYDHPCLVTAVDQRMFVTLAFIDSKELIIDAPDVKIAGYHKSMENVGSGEIPKGAAFVEVAVMKFREEYPFTNGLKVTTKSQFSSEFGFGSSSAATVCVIKGLSALTGKKLSEKEIFTLAYKTVLAIQKKGSGFDVAAAVYGGTLYFKTGGSVIKKLKIKEMPLLVGYTGVKADTVTLINQVNEKAQKYPAVIDAIYENIEIVVELARKAIIKKDWQTVGELMNINQGYLESLGVSTDRLSQMIYQARYNGCYGAKLSGAGGGDCMIALAPQKNSKSIENAFSAVGGKAIQIQPNAQGVRIEKEL